MITYFNQTVFEMDIDRKYKMTLLGIVTALLQKHDEDVAQIVRCKECTNHGKEICYFWSHFYGTINTPDDGFCYKAERRTDD